MKVTEIQVLERAIKDAMKGGLSKLDLLALLPPGYTDQHIMVMLYDHRFLKALFGTGGMTSNCHDAPVYQEARLDDVKLDKPFNSYSTKDINKMTQLIYCTECHQANGTNSTMDWLTHGKQLFVSGDPVAYIAQNKYGVKIDDTTN